MSGMTCYSVRPVVSRTIQLTSGQYLWALAAHSAQGLAHIPNTFWSAWYGACVSIHLTQNDREGRYTRTKTQGRCAIGPAPCAHSATGSKPSTWEAGCHPTYHTWYPHPRPRGRSHSSSGPKPTACAPCSHRVHGVEQRAAPSQADLAIMDIPAALLETQEGSDCRLLNSILAKDSLHK